LVVAANQGQLVLPQQLKSGMTVKRLALAALAVLAVVQLADLMAALVRPES
jgi:hypothetical protein